MSADWVRAGLPGDSMKIKTQDLRGAALDWAVAKCEGAHPQISYPDKRLFGAIGDTFDYSTDWAQGGPIIECEGISIYRMTSDWSAAYNPSGAAQDGPTPLIAAMRCFCCSKLGDVVDIPEELCQQQSN